MMNKGQSEQPTIFLIEEDDETRRPLVSNLRGYGYRVIVAVDEADALERVGGVEADLMLVNLVGKTAEEVLAVGGGCASTPPTTGGPRSSSCPRGTRRSWRTRRSTSVAVNGSSTSARSPTGCASCSPALPHENPADGLSLYG